MTDQPDSDEAWIRALARASHGCDEDCGSVEHGTVTLGGHVVQITTPSLLAAIRRHTAIVTTAAAHAARCEADDLRTENRRLCGVLEGLREDLVTILDSVTTSANDACEAIDRAVGT